MHSSSGKNNSYKNVTSSNKIGNGKTLTNPVDAVKSKTANDCFLRSGASCKTGAPIVILTGGGTGGHVYPNLALIPAIKNKGFEVVYVGGEGATIEQRLAAKENLNYYALPSVKLIRSFKPKAVKQNLSIPFVLTKSKNLAVETLKDLKPAAVFSKGGYVSLPVALAALELGIPVFCHESDLTQGLANKIAVKRGATSLKGNPKSTFKGVFVGMPLRDKLFLTNRDAARRKLGFNCTEKILLVVGGSSGATALNDSVIKNIDELTKSYTVVHITGKGKKSGVPNAYKNRYFALEYSDNIEDYLCAADLVVSRAGATAVFEISSLKKRALFIPLPKGVSRGDQIYNADLAKEYGASVLKQDKNFENNFLKAINDAFTKPPMKEIENDANGKIAELICASINRGGLCKDKKQ